MASKYLIGLDIGTSGAKCILVDDKGAVLASSTQEYPLSTPKPGWAEQDPQDWWDAVVRGLKVILPKANVPKDQIAGVSFSGQMHGLVALDKDLNVIRPAILWCDSRTQKQCDWITEKAGGLSGLLTYLSLIHIYGLLELVHGDLHLLGQILNILLAGGQELVERRIEVAHGHRAALEHAVHGLKVALLIGQQLVQRHLAGLDGLGNDHLAHGADARCV